MPGPFQEALAVEVHRQVHAGADAVLAATVFHFGTVSIGEVKTALAETGHPIR